MHKHRTIICVLSLTAAFLAMLLITPAAWAQDCDPDNEPPIIVCADDAIVECDAVPPIENGVIAATDNCVPPPLEPTISFTEAISDHTIIRTYTALDPSGNSASCTWTIQVVDTTSPVLTGCPSDLFLECDEEAPPLPEVTATDNCDDSVDVLFFTDAGPGFVTHQWSATDDSGNISACSQTINIVDTTPPAITCPADIAVDTDTCVSGEVITYDVPATDNCSDPVVDCSPPSGSTFPLGTTDGTCTATDDAGNTATCAFNVDVDCANILCRTAGFWGTHAGEECPRNKPDCGSQNITQDVIDACGGPGEQCLEICGESIFNTDLDSGNSALEAMCVSPAGDQALQLARQLTATALNCCISVGEDDCEGIDEWEDIFIFCNSVCALNLTDSFDFCIDTLDCLNKGGIPLEFDNPGFLCQTGICEPVDGDGFVDQVDGGLPCNEDYGCPFGYECIPLSDTCHDKELCNEDLGLCYGELGPAGSKDACTLAKGDGKGKKAGNDCAILPKLYSDDCSRLNQGEECCGTDSEEACEACGHGVFETGLGLDMFCDPCVTKVCFEDPYCCDDEEGEWDLKCVNEAIDLCSIPCVDSCPGFVETALDSLLIPDVTPPDMTCAEAVDLLNERSIGTPDVVCDGTDRSDDAAYIMVARLIEAEANYINGAPTCGNATDAINQAIALLDALNFDGMSSYLPPSSSYPIELRQYALDLAGVLDAYNNTIGSCAGVSAPPTDIWTGTVIVQKVMISDIDTFMFTGDVAGSISIDGGTLSEIVLIGETSSTEVLTAAQVTAGWVLTDISCNDGNSTGDLGTATATFRVEAGELVTCTFSNTYTGP
jgi:hypothetical protein